MSDYVRVYHPTGNAWADVLKGEADAWKASGYLKTKPAHVDDSAAPKPGEGYEAPAVVDVSGNSGAHVDVPEAAPAKADEK